MGAKSIAAQRASFEMGPGLWGVEWTREHHAHRKHTRPHATSEDMKCTCAYMYSDMESCLHRHTETQLHGHRHTETQLHGHAETRLPGHAETQLPGHTETQLPGHMEAQLH